MSLLDLVIARTDPSGLVVQSLPDGSAAIFEVATSNVYSLNAHAAAAWEACASATTLPEIARAMSSRLQAPVTEDLAHAAVSELEAVGLARVRVPEALQTTRRDLLRQLAGAIPMVLVLTGVDQRAFAQQNGSGPITPPPPGEASFSLVKRISPPDPPDPIVPAVGFTFELRSLTGPLALPRTTDGSGRAEWIDIPTGIYELVETDAPGGPYEPFEPVPVVLGPGAHFSFDLANVLTEGPPNPSTSVPPGDGSFCIIKRISPPDPPDPVVPAVGFTFQLRSTSGSLVLTRVTDSAGRAEWIDIPSGSYRLFETGAPGGPFKPFEPIPVLVLPGSNICFDIVNVLANP
jgi:hypothetical protein